ncbi:hypothetical protein Ciccas_003574 [Cichlidogyrus casuarinus]|uniref:Uncharacterized protein n=1 Tax=Cichlidogyrus casuarinus TaxID=1844966 RepID=A0ABD2QDZ4_9PLAT
MRPTSQPIQRAAMPQQIVVPVSILKIFFIQVYPPQAGRPILPNQYLILSKNGMGTVPSAASNMIPIRSVSTAQPIGQANGSIPILQNHEDYWDEASCNSNYTNMPYNQPYNNTCSRLYYDQRPQRMAYCYGPYPPYDSSVYSGKSKGLFDCSCLI